MPRLPLVEADSLTADQQAVFNQIAGGARGRVGYPFRLLLHSPALASRVEKVGEFLRFQSSLPDSVRELAICVVAARWKSDVEWNAHSRLARQYGIADAVLDDVAAGRRPGFTDAVEETVFDFVDHVLQGTGLDHLPDPVFDAARRFFGEAGVVELTGLVGYYTTLAMLMNTFEVLPEDARAPWRAEAAS